MEMKLEDVKLNQWFWGTLPEGLDPYAEVTWGGYKREGRDCSTRMYACNRLSMRRNEEGWWAILSLGPPKEPEPELRLPEGWDTEEDQVEKFNDAWSLTVSSDDPYRYLSVQATTRAECIRDLQKMIDAVTT
jgi:hypothetical protein